MWISGDTCIPRCWKCFWRIWHRWWKTESAGFIPKELVEFTFTFLYSCRPLLMPVGHSFRNSCKEMTQQKDRLDWWTLKKESLWQHPSSCLSKIYLSKSAETNGSLALWILNTSCGKLMNFVASSPSRMTLWCGPKRMTGIFWRSRTQQIDGLVTPPKRAPRPEQKWHDSWMFTTSEKADVFHHGSVTPSGNYKCCLSVFCCSWIWKFLKIWRALVQKCTCTTWPNNSRDT